MVDAGIINNTIGKMALHLRNHKSILCSVSGGSDSDIIVHMISTYFREFLPKIHFVFVNTGLEYQATRNHLYYLEHKYDIHIERIRGMPVPVAVKKYGVPVISKDHSYHIKGFCNGAKSSMAKVDGTYFNKRYCFSEKCKNLAYAVKDRNISISAKCCEKSKKTPLAKFCKDNYVDLNITGERLAEGGARAGRHKNCFEPNTSHGYDKYMPLWFWNDDTKQYYKDSESIRYSDCYEIWGMKRTGCVGCPFNSEVGRDLKYIQKYEPNMYKACMNVFGESYHLMDEFHIRRWPILDQPTDEINTL